jgi:hypothetical protein
MNLLKLSCLSSVLQIGNGIPQTLNGIDSIIGILINFQTTFLSILASS